MESQVVSRTGASPPGARPVRAEGKGARARVRHRSVDGGARAALGRHNRRRRLARSTGYQLGQAARDLSRGARPLRQGRPVRLEILVENCEF